MYVQPNSRIVRHQHVNECHDHPMTTSIDELELPKTLVQRLIKNQVSDYVA